jgi:hypothetical protein
MKIIYIFIIALLLSGCDLLESQADKSAKIAQEKAAFEKKIQETKEIELKKIDAQTQQELAKIATQKELAKIEKERMLEKIRLNAELQKQKLALQEKKAKILLDAKLAEQEHADSMEIKRYLLVILFLMLIIIAFFTYYYFKKRHEDKLRAYHDNLEKYFHQQENITKMKIAEKIIDTVASGKLEKEQEIELIRALGTTNPPAQEPRLLADKEDETIELIAEKE